ncbi:hypothetical protein L484_013134 [Morus notabilis]|uniref:Uncharacterized protein n=1 Tax=Morus notabilis TaxID=981085 RepID=W9RBU1_9ROSA|nr:hypothetical protein L484_013134 [Morus notabilis]
MKMERCDFTSQRKNNDDKDQKQRALFLGIPKRCRKGYAAAVVLPMGMGYE